MNSQRKITKLGPGEFLTSRSKEHMRKKLQMYVAGTRTVEDSCGTS
jgi:hypothetical protein